MLLFSIITPISVSLATKFLIPVTAELNVSRTEFTLSNVILQGMGIFLSPIVSQLYEKYKFKVLHSIGIISFAIGIFSYGLVRNMFQFYLISIVLGVCFLLVAFIPMTILIARWFNDKRGIATSIAMTGIGIGGLILSPLLTLWIDNYGRRMTYMIYGVMVLVLLLPITLFVFKENPEALGLTAYEEPAIQDDTKSAKEAKSFNFKLSEVSKQPFYYLLLLGSVTNGLVNSGGLGQYPPAFVGVQSASFAAIIISLYSVVGIFGKIILGAINDKFGIIASIIYGCGLILLTNVASLFANLTPVAYILAIIFGLGNAIGTVIPPLLASTFFSNKDFGKAYGVMSGALQLGMTTGSLMVAYIFDLTGAYTTAWNIIHCHNVYLASCLFQRKAI